MKQPWKGTDQRYVEEFFKKTTLLWEKKAQKNKSQIEIFSFEKLEQETTDGNEKIFWFLMYR